MGDLVQVFEASGPAFFNTLNGMLVITGFFFVITAIILVAGNKIAYNYRILLAMLSFFFGVIALGNGFYIKMIGTEVGTIKLYQNGIETPQGTARFSDIKDAYIYVDKEKSMINSNQVIDTKRVLMIELNDGQRFKLPEQYYPIEEIVNQLK